MAEWSTVPIEDSKQQLLIGKVCNPWTWRVANGFMAVFFALAAYVQVSVRYVFFFLYCITRSGDSVAISSIIHRYDLLNICIKANLRATMS